MSEHDRGRILHRIGEGYRRRYRIFNPILRPYIVMRGVREKLIDKAVLDREQLAPPGETQAELWDHATLA